MKTTKTTTGYEANYKGLKIELTKKVGHTNGTRKIILVTMWIAKVSWINTTTDSINYELTKGDTKKEATENAIIECERLLAKKDFYKIA